MIEDAAADGVTHRQISALLIRIDDVVVELHRQHYARLRLDPTLTADLIRYAEMIRGLSI